jgi:hypothetical protein
MKTIAYAAQSADLPLACLSFERRELRPNTNSPCLRTWNFGAASASPDPLEIHQNDLLLDGEDNACNGSVRCS